MLILFTQLLYLFTPNDPDAKLKDIEYHQHKCIHPINAVTYIFITANIFLLIANVVLFLIRRKISTFINDIPFRKTQAMITNARYTIYHHDKTLIRLITVIKPIIQFLGLDK